MTESSSASAGDRSGTAACSASVIEQSDGVVDDRERTEQPVLHAPIGGAG
jgi:hypothetical protein